MWGRASASSRSPSAVNRLSINLQTNTAAQSQTSPGNRTGECRVLPTRGGLARCLLAPGRQSAAPLRRSSRSGPTCRQGGEGRELVLRRGASAGKTKRPAYQNIRSLSFSFSASARHFPPRDVMLLADRLEQRHQSQDFVTHRL